jgi:hypothetical protein
MGILNVRKDRTAENEIEVPVLERQVRNRRYRGKLHGWPQILDAPLDMSCTDIYTPKLSRWCELGEMPEHSAGGAAEF